MEKISTLKIIFDKYYRVFIIFFGLLQIWMISGMDIYQLGDALQDNVLMIDYAESICKGEWLGEYSNNTLIKRISYPLFLAFCYKFHVPYLIVLAIFWVFSIFILVVALRKIIKSKIGLFILYILMLFNPVMYNSNFTLMIYRNAIVPPAVVLTIACLIGLYTRRNENYKVVALWSISSGVTFAFFWNIREDSIWLLPFYLGALLISAIGIMIAIGERQLKMKKICLIICSLLCVLGINAGIKLTNYTYYGIYTDSELFHSNYTDLQNLLTSIEEENEIPGIIVSKKTVERLYENSPTFAELEPYMNKHMYGTFWQVLGDNIDDGEVYGGYFFWGLRDVVQAAGYYKDAKTANDFYNCVYKEIEGAVEKGDISLKEKRFTILGIDVFGKDAFKILETVINNIKNTLSYRNLNYATTISNGNKKNLRRTEIVTKENIIYESRTRYNFEGWIVPTNDRDIIRIDICTGKNRLLTTVGLSESIDVYDYYKQKNNVKNRAKQARFSEEILGYMKEDQKWIKSKSSTKATNLFPT